MQNVIYNEGGKQQECGNRRSTIVFLFLKKIAEFCSIMWNTLKWK